MLKGLIVPLTRRKNKKIFSLFLKEGRRASWPIPVFQVYKHYFDYTLQQVQEYQFERWLKDWYKSTEHVEFILNEFSEEQLLQLADNYEDWSHFHHKYFERKKYWIRYSHITKNENIDEKVKKVLYFLHADLENILQKIKIK